MRLLTPDLYVPSVTKLTREMFSEKGIQALLLDLDDTLVKIHHSVPDPKVVEWLAEMQRAFRLYIVSNNSSAHRVASFAEPLGIPYTCRAFKPFHWGFQRALGELDLLPKQVAMIGDQLFTDVAGGRLMGALTVLVSPMSEETQFHRQVMRKAEQLFWRGNYGLR